jgi:chromosome segregation ATPase
MTTTLDIFIATLSQEAQQAIAQEFRRLVAKEQHAALLESVEARLAMQRRAIIDEYVDRIAELDAAARLQQDRIAALEDGHNELVSAIESLQRRLTAAEELLEQARRALCWNNVRCRP